MSDERPHSVVIGRRLLVARTETTQAEWKALMKTSPARFDGCGESCPVERVSWYDAIAYANRLSRSESLEPCYEPKRCSGSPGTGCPPENGFCVGDYRCRAVEIKGPACRGYRLPTEAEWEFLARAGSDGASYAGKLEAQGERSSSVLDGIAWHGGNSGITYEKGFPCAGWKGRKHSAEACGTHPVARKRANAWGLSDMLGNVWEWTEDLYHEDFGSAPGDGRPVLEPPSAFRTFRGCSWVSRVSLCRSAARNRQIGAYRSFGVGFRLVRTLPDS